MVNRDKDLSKRLATTLLVVILILSETLIYFHATTKYGYHIDELLSFAHANSSEGGFLFPAKISGLVFDENDIVFNKWVEPEVFWNYLTVQENEAFRYSEISNNLSDSVHPPLYYFLLHTVSSFFPETLSKWLGIVPNMVLFSLVLLVLYKTGVLLLQSKGKSLLACAVFGLSIEAVNVTIFIRSYLLLTLLTLLLVLEVIKLFLDEKSKPGRFFFVFLFSILGLLTHYYFYVFFVIFSTIVSLSLWVRKQNRTLFSFLGIILFALVLSFLISPNIIRHLFSSIRGIEAGVRAVLGSIALACITIISLLVYRIIRKKNVHKEFPTVHTAIRKMRIDLQTIIEKSSTIELMFIVLFLSLLLTAIVIKLVAPPMDVHSDRYFFNLIPLLCLTGTALLFLIANKHLSGKKYSVLISITIITISIFTNIFIPSAYVFPPTENRALLNQEIQDSFCLFITDSDGKIHNFADVFFTAERVFSARGISATSITNAFSQLKDPQKITIIINNQIPQIPEELSILEDKVGYPIQYLYVARHGHYLYRVYTLASN